MFNTNFSTLPTIRTSQRLICVWVPTGNPRMPLTCVWLEDAPSPEDSAADEEADGPVAKHYVFSTYCLDSINHRPPSNIKIR